MIIYRHYRTVDLVTLQPESKGGVTIAYDTETNNAGLARCAPCDNFSRKLGRQIASDRLARLNNMAPGPHDTTFFAGTRRRFLDVDNSKGRFCHELQVARSAERQEPPASTGA